jgi:hypothetical protein
MGFIETGEWESGIVADEGTLSAAIDLGRVCEEAVIYVPTIDNATVAVYVAMTLAGTYAALKLTNVDGTEEAILAGASTGGFFWRVPLGAQYMKILCGAAQTNGPRTFYVRGT